MGLGSFLKKAGNVIGKVGKYAAPVLAATGVGMPLAIGIGAGGGMLEKATSGKSGGVKGVLGSGLKSGAVTAAGGLAGKMLARPGGLGGKVGGLLGKAGGGGGIMDRISQITGLGRPGGLDARDLITAGVGLYGAKQAHDAGKQGDSLMDERLAIARERLAEARPIRQRANAELMGSMDRLGGKMLAPPDLSFLQDRQNPFRKRFTPGAVQMET